MNIGSAVRSQEFDAVHIDVASTWPAGVATFVRTAAKPHTANASAIQTPEPRIANKSNIRNRESSSTFMAQPSLPNVMASSAARKLGRPRFTTMNSSSTSAMVRISAPIAIAACG